MGKSSEQTLHLEDIQIANKVNAKQADANENH